MSPFKIPTNNVNSLKSPDLLSHWFLDQRSFLHSGLVDLNLNWELDLQCKPIAFKAFSTSSGNHLGTVEVRIYWPPSIKSAYPTGQIAVNFVSQPTDSISERQLFLNESKVIANRCGRMDSSLNRTLHRLFPRTLDGTISWEKIVFSRIRSDASNRQKNAYVALGNLGCNLSCEFCTRSVEKTEAKPSNLFFMSQVYDLATHLPPGKPRSIMHIGGDEPTLHPELLSIMSLGILRKYKKIILLTSEPERFDRDFIGRLIKVTFPLIEMPLYGVNPKTHDSIVGRSGHFEATLEAISRLRRSGITVNIHSLVTKTNALELSGLRKLCRTLGCGYPSFEVPRVEGPSREPPGKFIPRLSEIPISVRLRIAHLFIPCTGVGIWPSSRLKNNEAKVGLPGGRVGRNGSEPLRPEKCGRCIFKGVCTGVYREYLELYGESEFTPIRFSYGPLKTSIAKILSR